MTKINVEIDENTLRMLVINYLCEIIGTAFKLEDVHIETKSAQNYKSTWERAEFRARVEKTK